MESPVFSPVSNDGYDKYVEIISHYTQVDRDKLEESYNSMMEHCKRRENVTSDSQVVMRKTTMFESKVYVDPKNMGLVVGKGGSTIKSVGGKHKVYAKVINSDVPYLVIRSHNPVNIETAALEFCKIAESGNRKNPNVVGRKYVSKREEKQSLMDVATFTIVNK